MFEPKNVDCWSCNDPSKIVESNYMDSDTHDVFRARFSLDEIKNVKYKIGGFYFIEFNCKPDKEFAIHSSAIEDNFNITFSASDEEPNTMECSNTALDNYYRTGF